MTLAGRDSGDLSMTFRDLKSFGARLSDLSRTLAGDPKMRVSDLKLSTLHVQLPVSQVIALQPEIPRSAAPDLRSILFSLRFSLYNLQSPNLQSPNLEPPVPSSGSVFKLQFPVQGTSSFSVLLDQSAHRFIRVYVV